MAAAPRCTQSGDRAHGDPGTRWSPFARREGSHVPVLPRWYQKAVEQECPQNAVGTPLESIARQGYQVADTAPNDSTGFAGVPGASSLGKCGASPLQHF